MKNIPLTRGEFALVDDSDFELVNQFKWHLSLGSGGIKYAARTVGGSTTKFRSLIRMHRFIMGAVRGSPLVDHENRNGLDNQRSNLRFATTSQNIANSKKCSGCTSKFKGVFYWRSRGKWNASIMVNGKRTYLGLFETEAEAAIAYENSAKLNFGKFARMR